MRQYNNTLADSSPTIKFFANYSARKANYRSPVSLQEMKFDENDK